MITGEAGLQKYFNEIYINEYTLTTYGDELENENFEQHENTTPTAKDETSVDEQHEKDSDAIEKNRDKLINRRETMINIDTEEDFQEYNADDDLKQHDYNDANNYNTTNETYHPTEMKEKNKSNMPTDI